MMISKFLFFNYFYLLFLILKFSIFSETPIIHPHTTSVINTQAKRTCHERGFKPVLAAKNTKLRAGMDYLQD